MVSSAPARPSLGALTTKLGPTVVRGSLTFALLVGALRLNDRVTELERREQALQGRAEDLARHEAMRRPERVDLPATHAPSREPLPLEDSVVIRASSRPEVLPLAGH